MIIPFVLIALGSMAQSKSYQTLKDRFIDQPDVQAFSFGGWLGRAALSFVSESDDPDARLLRKAMADIDHIRFLVIPKQAFREQNLSVNGFRSYLSKDEFDMLADIKDNGERVTFYQREEDARNQRYFVLIDEADEVVAIEMKGYIDPSIFEGQGPRVTVYAN